MLASHEIKTEEPMRKGDKGLVLMLPFYYPPDSAAGSQRAGRFVKYVPQFGHRVHVIAGSESTRESGPPVTRVPDPRAVSALGNLVSRSARCAQRLASTQNDRWNWAPHAVQAAEGNIGENQVTTALLTSPPISAPMAALWLKLRHNIRWIADFRDPLILQNHPFRSNFHIRQSDRPLEPMIFRHAVVAFTAGNSTAESVLAKSGVPSVCIDPQESETKVDKKVQALFHLLNEPIQPNQWFQETFDGERQAQSLAALLDSVA